MITIISGTNRLNSNSILIARYYQRLFESMGTKAQVLDLTELPNDFIYSALYDNAGLHDDFNMFQELVDATDKYLFVVPEYNNSYPGVLKAFIDGLRYPGSFAGKKAAMVGLSAGMQGGALAISHLTDVLNYLGMHVLAQKPKLAFVHKYLEEGNITNELYKQLIQEQAEAFISF
jgi:chromate reductase, NAD(P)H dehydrogenase (quinone)